MKAMPIIFCMIFLLVITSAFAENISLISSSLLAMGNVHQFEAYGRYAILSSDYFDVAIVDLEDETEGYPISYYNRHAGTSIHPKIGRYEDYLYLKYTDMLQVLSLRDIKNPAKIAELGTPGGSTNMAIQGDRLYTYSSGGLLQSYSLANPANPTPLASLQLTPHQYARIFPADGFLLYCCGSIVHVIDTASMKVVSQISLNLSVIRAVGKQVFVAYGNTLRIFDLSDAANPILLSTTEMDTYQIYRFDIWQDTLWALCINDQAEYAEMGLISIDISSFAAPFVLDNELLPDMWIENYAYMLMSQGLMILQNGGILRWRQLSNAAFTELQVVTPLYSYSGLASSDQYLIGEGIETRLLTLDAEYYISEDSLLESSACYIDQKAIQDDYLIRAFTYDADGHYQPQMEIISLLTQRKLGSIQLPSHHEYGGMILDMQVQGSYVYICLGYGGLVCVDISNPAMPVQKFHITTGMNRISSVYVEAERLWLSWDYSYNGSYIEGYDISDVDHPEQLFSQYLGTYIYPKKLIKREDYLFMLNGAVVMSYHIEQDGVTHVNNTYCNSSDMNTMLPIGKGILVAGKMGMLIFSLQDLLQPKRVASYWFAPVQTSYPGENPYPWVDFAIRGRYIITANGRSVNVYDAIKAYVLCDDYPRVESGELMVFPNPTHRQINLFFKTKSADPIDLKVFNLRGQRVLSVAYPDIIEGKNCLQIDLKDKAGKLLPTGVYIIQLSAKGYKKTAKVLLRG